MSALLCSLPDILAAAQARVGLALDSPETLALREVVYPAQAGTIASPSNRLMLGDNLAVMAALCREGLENSVDLLYADPPFESNRVYRAQVPLYLPGADETLLLEPVAYEDKWEDGLSGYLAFMTPRLILMHRLLADSGTLYLHVDGRVSHYLKLILDAVFGRENFRNEIIWQRDSAGKGAKGAARQWSRENDHLLMYSKSASWYFQPVYRDKLTDTQLREYIYAEPDGRRFKKVQLGDYSPASIRRLREENRIYTTSTGRDYKKYYLDEARFPLGSNWTDIVNLSKGQHEQRGYPTQKPEKLLERIILASCAEGGLVADFFSGAGTAGVVAEKLNRRWWLADNSPSGFRVARGRLLPNIRGSFEIQALPGNDVPVSSPVLQAAIHPAEGNNIQIELKHYHCPDVEALCTQYALNGKTPQVLARVLDQSPFSLLDHWAVDPAYNGGVFHGRLQVYRRSSRKTPDALPLSADIPLSQVSDKPLCVRAMDIFGQVSEVLLPLVLTEV